MMLRARQAAGAVVVLSLSACGSAGQAGEATLYVYAASSLQVPFEEIAADFEAARSGVDVQLNFAGSSDLAAQIRAGAPAEVFASANEATMEQVAAEQLLASEPRPFATNVLTIAVAEGNPLGIESLVSLAEPGVSVVLCAPQVPCGSAAGDVQELTGVSITPVSEEGSVTDVLGKVSSGQADAGLVYVTDAAATGGSVDSVPFDAAARAENVYPIAVTGTGGDLAAEFVDFVTGAQGQRVLAAHGFGKPGQ